MLDNFINPLSPAEHFPIINAYHPVFSPQAGATGGRALYHSPHDTQQGRLQTKRT